MAGGDAEQPERAARHRVSGRDPASRRRLGEELATGTGFPKVFYPNYHLYRDYFPILALAAFAHARHRQD